ncbi:hypothetical protein [uncultured Croceitalea sp.]
MNTRKLFFGFLAVAVLAVVSLSTTITIDDSQELGVRKSQIKHK